MRALAKGPKPEILQAKEELWTANYVAARGTSSEQRNEKWRHVQIKAALREETRSRCAYCEAFVADVAFPHVEHMVPKSVRPDLAHRWANLTTACEPCNIAKSNFYDQHEGILDPYEDDIDAHLVFLGDFVDWQLGNTRGEVTVKTLDLNRLDLVHSRVERVRAVREMLERWHESTGVRREVLAGGLRMEVERGEFTAAVRAFLGAKGFPLN
jgi:uncharacterized protein (TIGR02646 family)